MAWIIIAEKRLDCQQQLYEKKRKKSLFPFSQLLPFTYVLMGQILQKKLLQKISWGNLNFPTKE